MRSLSVSKFFALCCLSALVFSCLKIAKKTKATIIHDDVSSLAKRAAEIRAKTAIKLADGLKMTLWASDSLAPDPVSMDMDDAGAVYLTRTNRQKNSEFDIRGYRHWMTESIGLKTVEERRAFLRKTFAPEKSKENEFVKDLNEDGSHDWQDLAVEKDEIWKLEDLDKDGFAEKATKIFSDFNEEITDVAGGLLVKGKELFYAIAPDLWKLSDTNNDGLPDKKTSISNGYGVHIGFSGHGMSGVIPGPDGRIYWNIGDIGANITAVDGSQHPNPNSGIIARANEDGSDFEIFATGLRNTHEFVFDEYGNLISSDNDGDHAGESERLVHVVRGSDAGWRSNWQYGKYTDPKNNTYKVWMDEKLYQPRWDGQAAYIIPPIQNFKNGPTGMQYNPGTALGKAWQNKFFLVEFVGTPSRSPIWSFGLKPKGASFVLDGEKAIVTGILPTGIRFGADGALYAADWINGWDTKNYGRVWKIDVDEANNDLAMQRKETQRLMQLNYSKQSAVVLGELLQYSDMRIRQKAQFELAKRGAQGLGVFASIAKNSNNQLAKINAIWGIGQLARQNASFGKELLGLLADKDPEIVAQVAKVMGDSKVYGAEKQLIELLKSTTPRVQFYAAEALGQLKNKEAVPGLLNMIASNNDQDIYLRHAAVRALSQIGNVQAMVNLAGAESKALRIAAVLVLRRLANENVALFLKDADEYIATEAARAINDDLSIPAALPALAAMLQQNKYNSEPLIRRAINAALRVGGTQQIDQLINYAKRNDISDKMRTEALATLGGWASPSVMDRVDGRHRGPIDRDASGLKQKMLLELPQFLANKNNETQLAAINMLGQLGISDFNEELVNINKNATNTNTKVAAITNLNKLNYSKIDQQIIEAMADASENVRTAALGMLNNTNTTASTLPGIVENIMTKGSQREKQQILTVLGKLSLDKTQGLFEQLIGQLAAKQLPNTLALELSEAIEASGSVVLKNKLSQSRSGMASLIDQYAEALNGGNYITGRTVFNNNAAAQCIRCHTAGRGGGNVGPDLSKIGAALSREQLLEALVSPSTRIAPGYGNVDLILNNGQTVSGVLAKETDTELTITTSDAEPLVIEKARIKTRENIPSGMPDMSTVLSKREIRDVVEFLTTLR
jgi:quinoprotein glucose dehydrogenase